MEEKYPHYAIKSRNNLFVMENGLFESAAPYLTFYIYSYTCIVFPFCCIYINGIAKIFCDIKSTALVSLN